MQSSGSTTDFSKWDNAAVTREHFAKMTVTFVLLAFKMAA